jgi:hypothetical protein
MGPKKRTYFVPGPPVKTLNAPPKKAVIVLPVSRSTIKLEALPRELILRNEVTSKLNVYSYFDSPEGESILKRSKSAATLKNKQQQFSILQDRQGSTESLVSANSRDRRAKENEEEGKQKLWHGGDLDDSIVDAGDQSLENNQVLTVSQADLQYALQIGRAHV